MQKWIHLRCIYIHIHRWSQHWKRLNTANTFGINWYKCESPLSKIIFSSLLFCQHIYSIGKNVALHVVFWVRHLLIVISDFWHSQQFHRFNFLKRFITQYLSSITNESNPSFFQQTNKCWMFTVQPSDDFHCDLINTNIIIHSTETVQEKHMDFKSASLHISFLKCRLPSVSQPHSFLSYVINNKFWLNQKVTY